MESADDCGDAWEYDAADALAAFGPGEDGAFADAADDLMDFCPGEDDAFADAAEELLQRGRLLPEEVAACKAWVAWRFLAENCEEGEGRLVQMVAMTSSRSAARGS